MKNICMKRRSFSFNAALLLGLLLVASSARAERLEVGLAVSPLLVLDNHYEAFSSGNRYAVSGGLDVRSEVVNLGGFRLAPFIGYRYAADSGEPHSVLETELRVHDFILGVRVRKGLTSWLGVLLDVKGGMLYADLEGELAEMYYDEDLDSRRRYAEQQLTWFAGAGAGLEFQISKSWLRSRGVRRFGFGGDVSIGYVKRGDLDLDPQLESSDENGIKAETLPWGNVDISGLSLQLGVCAKFF